MSECSRTSIIVLTVFMTGSILIAFSGMVLLHELGHVAALVLSGGEVDYVRVSPIDFGFTARASDPHPLIATWGGPLLGCAFTMVILLLVAFAAPRFIATALLLVVVAFLANGMYLAVGVFSGVGDAGDLIRHGAPPWSLIAAGIPLIAAGIYFASMIAPVLRVGKPCTSMPQTCLVVGLPIALYLAAMFAGPAITYSLGIPSTIGALLAAALLAALAAITVHRAPHKCNRLVARFKPPRLHTALIAVAVGVVMIVIELAFLHR